MAELLKYEIAHDLLARQVFARFSVEEKTLRKAERMLGDSYELHLGLSERGEGSRLLNREELIFLKPYLNQINPEKELVEYLKFSEQTVTEAEQAETRRLEAEIARQKEEQKRQRKWLGAAIVAGLVMLAIAIFAGISYKQANDTQLVLIDREDSIKFVLKNLEQANLETELQKDTALFNEQEALIAKRNAEIAQQASDEARSLSDASLISLQEAQVRLLAEKRVKDSLFLIEEKLNQLAENRFSALGEAQGRELGKLRNAIYQLQYEQGFSTILDATKLGIFNLDVRDGLLELAYYFSETDNSNLTDSIMDQVAFMDGTSRGGDANPLQKENIEDLAGEVLIEKWSKRYFPQMLTVEGGTFMMGESSIKSDQAGHKVSLRDFSISQYEVSVYQYEMFLRDTKQSLLSISAPVWGWQGDNPMINVNWYDALRYCNWLSRKMNHEEVYQINGTNISVNWDANGYRLPTEAEWEYAAGGGKPGRNSEGFRNNLYAGSDDINLVAWYNTNSDLLSGYTRALPVGQKRRNELGLYDMSGNVWEWCFDWYGAYVSANSQNPKGLSGGSKRVARGGSWNFDAEVSQVDYRSRYAPAIQYDDLGFRVVRNK